MNDAVVGCVMRWVGGELEERPEAIRRERALSYAKAWWRIINALERLVATHKRIVAEWKREQANKRF